MRRAPSFPPSARRGSGSRAAAARTRSPAQTSRPRSEAPHVPGAECEGSALREDELSVVAQLAQQRARFAFDVLDLLGREVLSPAADRTAVHRAERLGERRRIGLEPACDPFGGGPRIRGDLLVSDLESLLRRRARRGHVAAPGPGRPRRLAGARELLTPLRLDPGARVCAVDMADVVAPF